MTAKCAVHPASGISIVVVFDNYPHRKDLKAWWGFSCVVRGAGKTILFDTGGDGAILMNNMKKLQIDPGTIDAVVLSHAHGDHTGGLKRFLGANPEVDVFMPRSFSISFKTRVRAVGARVVEVGSPQEICPGVWSTGEAGTDIVEESLVVCTDQGPILITGCAHPGVVEIARKARGLIESQDVLLAMGGFHLRDESDSGLKSIIAGLQDLSVQRAGPCHCSGDRARELFLEAYGKDYVVVGAGARVRFD